MITKYKNLTVSKLKDSNDNPKSPTHALVVTDKNYENKKTVGKFWKKEGTYGKFLSGTMSDKWEKDGKVFDGFVIVSEQELDMLIEKLSMKENSPLGNDYPTELNPDDIPF